MVRHTDTIRIPCDATKPERVQRPGFVIMTARLLRVGQAAGNYAVADTPSSADEASRSFLGSTRTV